jgi:hypothetical protein
VTELDEKTKAQLKEQHGDRIEQIDLDDDLFVVAKPPSEGEYERFTSMLLDDEQKPKAMKTLVLACVVYPPKDEFRALIKERPALIGTIGKELHAMAGAAKVVKRKKL